MLKSSMKRFKFSILMLLLVSNVYLVENLDYKIIQND